MRRETFLDVSTSLVGVEQISEFSLSRPTYMRFFIYIKNCKFVLNMYNLIEQFLAAD